MYQHRLLKWGISKNMTKLEKDELLRNIEQNGRLELLDLSLQDLSIEPKTLLKLRRHIRDRQNGQPNKINDDELLPSSHQEDALLESLCSSGMPAGNQRHPGDHSPADPGEEPTGTRVLAGHSWSSDRGPARVLKICYSNIDEPSPSSDFFHANSLDQDKSLFQSFLPSPALRTGLRQQGFQIDLVMHNVKMLCQLELQRLRGVEADGTRLGSEPTYEVSQFWNNTAQGFYLLKVAAPHRAWPTLQKTLQIPARSVAAHPLILLKKLFSTLSPTNTRISPQARRLILNHLSKTELGPWHPVTVITSQLLRDNHDQDVSKEILLSILRILNDELGWKHDLTMDLRRAVIIMLRRSLDLDAADDMATKFLYDAQQEFGPGSLQARTLATELAHVRVDKGEYRTAAKLSLAVVGHPESTPRTAFVGPSFHDGQAIYAMEDLANIHSRLGEIDSSVIWLEKAAHDAWDLWKDDVASVHICDKLIPLLRQRGRREDADWYSKRIGSEL